MTSMFVDPHNSVRNIKSTYNHMSSARAWDKENSLVFTKYNTVRACIHQLQCHYQVVINYAHMLQDQNIS